VGTAVDVERAKTHIKQGKAVLFAVFNHAVLMPLLLWAAARMDTSIPLHYRFALVMIGVVPGGLTSNVICLWLKMDAALSVTVTTITSLLALGFMPLNTYIYLEVAGLGPPPNVTDGSSISNYALDWVGLGVTFAVVIGGLFIGMGLQRVLEKRSLKKVELIGILAFIPQVGMALYQNTQTDANAFALPYPSLYALMLFPAVVAFAWVAFVGRKVLGLEKPSCVALGLEATIQNIAIVIAVISLSLSDPVLSAEALGVPIAFTMIMWIVSIVFGLGFWRAGWSELDPKVDANPCTVWCREFYSAFKPHDEENQPARKIGDDNDPEEEATAGQQGKDQVVVPQQQASG
jgi:predicted Na+-dependent transporter